jgi:hypothetical protein
MARLTTLAILGAALAWTLHLLASYAVVALACARGWRSAGPALAALTVVCVAAALGSGLLAWRRWRAESAAEAEARPALMLMGLLASPVFTLAILLGGIVPAVLPLCPVS